MQRERNFVPLWDFIKTMTSLTTMIQNTHSGWTLEEKGKLPKMSTTALSTIHLIFRREVGEVVSFVTYSFDVRTKWINHQLATYMGKVVKEFYHLKDWEVVCYYYSQP